MSISAAGAELNTQHGSRSKARKLGPNLAKPAFFCTAVLVTAGLNLLSCES